MSAEGDSFKLFLEVLIRKGVSGSGDWVDGSSGGHRYGFNGQEKDDEIYGGECLYCDVLGI